MNGATDFDRLLHDWLDAEGAQDIPPRVVDAAIATARHTSRRRPPPHLLTRFIPMDTTFPLTRPMPLARLGAALLLLLLTLALIAAALFAAGSSPSPFRALSEGLIAFDTNGDIVVANPDGTNVTPIVTGPAMQVGPSWSPDGRRLAYFERVTGDGDYAEATDEFLVYTVGPNGGDWFDVTGGKPIKPVQWAGANGLRWSSDSGRLAVAIQDQGVAGGRSRIAILDADGSSSRILDLPVDAEDPIWQPGSDMIAFRVPVDTADGGVWVVHADAADPPRRLTTRSAIGDGYAFIGPSWSVSGDRIVYGCCAGPHDVWTVDLAGTETQVTTDLADEYWATWSPVDDRIVFQRDTTGGTAPANDEYVIGGDATQTRVEVEPTMGWGPLVWSPTGDEILVLTSDTTELLVVSLDGGHEPYRIPMTTNGMFGTGWSWQRVP